MKKLLGIAFAMTIAIILAGCASKPTGDARETSAYAQNIEMGLPAWAGTQFKSGWNK